MKYIMVDVETDGPCPGIYSMVALGAVVVEPGLKRTFKRFISPVTDNYVDEALAACRLTREQTKQFNDPELVMVTFSEWLKYVSQGDQLRFVSDNNGFDWQFINYYFHRFVGKNPFGFSSINLNSVWKGMQKTTRVNIKKMRKTKHTHDPLDDAMGNAEAMLTMIEKV